MKEKCFVIRLNSLLDIRNFNSKISTLNGTYDLSCGRYTVDAKSVMGIFSLDVTKELYLTAYNMEELDVLYEKIGVFIVGERSLME